MLCIIAFILAGGMYSPPSRPLVAAASLGAAAAAGGGALLRGSAGEGERLRFSLAGEGERDFE